MANKRNYRLSFKARDDLASIWLHIFESSSSIERADHVITRLFEAFDILADGPELGHRREDLTEKGIKFWSVFSYLIVYDPKSVPVDIQRVIHGARDVESLIE